MAARVPVPDAVVEACAAGLCRRIAARMAEDAERADRLRELSGRAAERLVAELGARRVWLFGSLAWGEPHGRSDVDLLVEGVPASAGLDALGIAEEALGVSVDVLRAEDAPHSLVSRVRREGVLLRDGD